MKLSQTNYKRIIKFQRDEITASILYKKIAQKIKDDSKKMALLEFAAAEYEHYKIWYDFTQKEVKPDWFTVMIYNVLFFILGQTFIIRYMERKEKYTQMELQQISEQIPVAKTIILQEEEHEMRLIAMIDEELKYVGSVVLGLNDALVELTGTIAGITFALMNTRLVALAAIVTGGAATLSMAASNYLAQRAEKRDDALRSSIYTGSAYLITVVLLVLPYLVLPDGYYISAFIIMIAVAVFIIFSFNYYIAVVQATEFWPKFFEMALISLGVAALSFAIGIVAKYFLGVNV